jgi:hypothetical protein
MGVDKAGAPPGTGRFLVLVGGMNSYADSWGWFLERGYAGFVLRPGPTVKWFRPNYGVLRSRGFREFREPGALLDALEEGLRSGRLERGLVVSGAHYYGHGDIYSFGAHTMRELEAYHRVLDALKRRGAPVLGVRTLCGETFFAGPHRAGHFAAHNRHTGVLVAETESLVRLVAGHCPPLRDRRFLVGPVNAPLKRFVRTEPPPRTTDELLYIGRWASAGRPRVDRPVREVSFEKAPLPISCNAPLAEQERARARALEELSPCRAGLGHFYDYFQHHAEDPDALLREPARRQALRYAGYTYFLPRCFRLCNVSGKVVTYLMCNVPPIIPDDPHNSFHRVLAERNMALAAGPDGAVPEASDEALAAMRRSIAANTALFTLDPTCRALDLLVADL